MVKEHNQNHKDNSKITQPKQRRTLVKKHDQAQWKTVVGEHDWNNWGTSKRLWPNKWRMSVEEHDQGHKNTIKKHDQGNYKKHPNRRTWPKQLQKTPTY